MALFSRFALFLVVVTVVNAFFWSTEERSLTSSKGSAIVTLVMGDEKNQGYIEGAIALGQSLKDVKSVLPRVCMVTPEVPHSTYKYLESAGWKVQVVQPINCIHKRHLHEREYDLSSSHYKQGAERWQMTCTKFRAWEMTDYHRVIFMDSDTLVVAPIDDVALNVGKAAAYSNATLAAAPESFPPDTFNAGFMLIEPNLDTFHQLEDMNHRIGSIEGGDQGVLNQGLCPNWHHAHKDDPRCGRLPWLFNVEAAYYEKYQTMRKISEQRGPAVIHFVSDAKPWQVLAYEYHPIETAREFVNDDSMTKLGGQIHAHMLWRRAYFKAADGMKERGIHNPGNKFLTEAGRAAASVRSPNVAGARGGDPRASAAAAARERERERERERDDSRHHHELPKLPHTRTATATHSSSTAHNSNNNHVDKAAKVMKAHADGHATATKNARALRDKQGDMEARRAEGAQRHRDHMERQNKKERMGGMRDRDARLDDPRFKPSSGGGERERELESNGGGGGGDRPDHNRLDPRDPRNREQPRGGDPRDPRNRGDPRARRDPFRSDSRKGGSGSKTPRNARRSSKTSHHADL
jgi:lipopolysaccharide biosynthesis glycosyltransferase